MKESNYDDNKNSIGEIHSSNVIVVEKPYFVLQNSDKYKYTKLVKFVSRTLNKRKAVFDNSFVLIFRIICQYYLNNDINIHELLDVSNSNLAKLYENAIDNEFADYFDPLNVTVNILCRKIDKKVDSTNLLSFIILILSYSIVDFKGRILFYQFLTKIEHSCEPTLFYKIDPETYEITLIKPNCVKYHQKLSISYIPIIYTIFSTQNTRKIALKNKFIVCNCNRCRKNENSDIPEEFNVQFYINVFEQYLRGAFFVIDFHKLFNDLAFVEKNPNIHSLLLILVIFNCFVVIPKNYGWGTVMSDGLLEKGEKAIDLLKLNIIVLSMDFRFCDIFNLLESVFSIIKLSIDSTFEQAPCSIKNHKRNILKKLNDLKNFSI